MTKGHALLLIRSHEIQQNVKKIFFLGSCRFENKYVTSHRIKTKKIVYSIDFSCR